MKPCVFLNLSAAANKVSISRDVVAAVLLLIKASDIHTMCLRAIYYVLIINSAVCLCSYIPNDISPENFELVFPKFYSKLRRNKRDLTPENESEFDLNITVVELANWVLEYTENNKIHFADNFTVKIVGEKNYTSNEKNECVFLTGKIRGINSQSAVTLCGEQMSGFVNTSYDLFFVQPLNETSGTHVLFSSDLARKHRAKRSDLGPVCFTSEFYNLQDEESADDDKLIELDDDEPEGNGRNPEEIRYNENWRKEQIDSEQMGYFYDSAWETHVFKKRTSHKMFAPKRWLEIAIGVDYSVIHFHGKNKVQRYIFALMNIVSAIYQDPSLEANMELVLTQMILYVQKKYSQIKVGNARKSLENVNIWNRKLHRTLGQGIQRHDIAVYLTRLDIGGPSGYAPVAGACDPSRSCSLNRDEGLSSAFIIAHEMAHVLGLTHDGDTKANNSCKDEAMQGSVMAPMVSSTFTDFSWSTCSKKEFHKRAANWYCLKNPPSGTTEVLKPTLQTTFSMDEQCRMEFGDGYNMCTAFEILEPCSHLWCGYKRSPLVCKTKKGPPLEGTQCGLNKFCLNGYCTDTYGYQLDPVMHNPQDGGWSEWSDWGPCSKSCGFGVQFRSRFCNNPTPAYGGNYCKGPVEEHQVCGREECPEPLQDPRAEQCARLPRLLNMQDPDKSAMTWLPYEADKKMLKCQLICISKQTGEILTSGENLIDGTKCSYDDADDICIQGICHPMDCAGYLEKKLVEDSCGICGGNNSQCVNLTSDFHRNIKREISRIGVIPRLTRNIKIECRLNTIRNNSENTVFFMMRDRLRGIRYNLTISPNKQINTFIIKGAKFHYSKRGNFLKLWARGPILEEILVSLFASPSTVNSGIGMTITTSYSIRKSTIPENSSRYTWVVGGWGPCTASCGGGTRARTLACRDTNNRRIVTRRHCSLADRPTLENEECNTFSCRFHWIPGPWEHCTSTCGSKGQQSRELYCVHHTIRVPDYGNATVAGPELYQQAVRPDRCTDEPPEINKPCNRNPCLAYWQPMEWSQCSTTCGAGVSKRDYHCPPPEGEPVYSCGPKPVEQTKKCRGPFNHKNNSLCKNRRRKSCSKDKSEVCALTDYLGKYCIIPQFRRICCKSCYSQRKFHI